MSHQSLLRWPGHARTICRNSFRYPVSLFFEKIERSREFTNSHEWARPWVHLQCASNWRRFCKHPGYPRLSKSVGMRGLGWTLATHRPSQWLAKGSYGFVDVKDHFGISCGYPIPMISIDIPHFDLYPKIIKDPPQSSVVPSDCSQQFIMVIGVGRKYHSKLLPSKHLTLTMAKLGMV